MSRTVHRPWIQRTGLVLVTVTFLLISVSMLTVGDVVTRRDWGGIVIYGLITVFSVIGIWFAARLGVVVGEKGIRCHNFGRGRFIRWDQITDVSCESYTHLGFVLYAPAVQVGNEETPLVLTAMSSSREEVGQRRVEAIRSRLG